MKGRDLRSSRTCTIAAVAATASLALVGCGGGAKTVTVAQPRHIPGVETGPQEPLPQATRTTYTAHLGPFKGGASSGSAQGTVTIEPGTNQICWTFSELKGLSKPTQGRLYRSFIKGPTYAGYLLGTHYTPSGCIIKQPIILRLLESKPHIWFMSIHDTAHPEGAIQGSLE
jgi:hypothetical protein